MLHSHAPVTIAWYEGLENYMSVAQSENKVLAAFFTVREWSFIRAIFEAVIREECAHLSDRGFAFKDASVEIYTDDGEVELSKQVFFTIIDDLYNVLIDGANEDHHNVRFEMWWQEFIDAAYILQQRCKLERLVEEERIETVHQRVAR